MIHQKANFLACLLVLSGFVLQAQQLTAITYNIRYDNPGDGLNSWEGRKAKLIAQLRFYEPDIFGTQEGLAHQLADIKEGMKTYYFLGKGRDDGKDAGEFSAIFYNSEKIDLLKGGTFWLSETPSEPSKGWDAALNRVCTYGLFRTKKEGVRFYVFNTHFDHKGEKARKESVQLILKKMKKINTERLPVVFMGDLNLEPEHSGIQLLSTQMTDTHTLAGDQALGPEGTYCGFEVQGPVTRRIDYIFISKEGFRLLKYGILSHAQDGRYASDHLPVYAKLAFTKTD